MNVQFAVGLTDDEKERLEKDIKHSLLAKQLRLWLTKSIDNLEISEEQLKPFSESELASLIGERRGLRSILKLIPENK